MKAFIVVNDPQTGKPQFQSVMLKGTPSGANDGLYKLLCDVNIGDVTIENVDVAICEEDGLKTTLYTDGGVADLSVDKHGRMWMLPQDLETAIMDAGDVVMNFTYNGTTDEINYIIYVSAKWNSLLGISKRVREQYTYDSQSRVTQIQRILENIPP